MYKKLNDLQFIIGLFFTVIALILLISAMISESMSGKLNITTGVVFLIFGLCMMLIKGKSTS